MTPWIPFRVVWCVFWHQFGRTAPHWPRCTVRNEREVVACDWCDKEWPL